MDDIDIQISAALARLAPRVTASPDWQDVLGRALAEPVAAGVADLGGVAGMREKPSGSAPAAAVDQPPTVLEEQGWGTRPIRRRQAAERRGLDGELQVYGWGTRPLQHPAACGAHPTEGGS